MYFQQQLNANTQQATPAMSLTSISMLTKMLNKNFYLIGNQQPSANEGNQKEQVFTPITPQLNVLNNSLIETKSKTSQESQLSRKTTFAREQPSLRK
jgi:hypothetical protein